MTGSTPHLSGRAVPRRSVVQGGAALGITSLALPSAALAASPLDAVYTSVVEGGRVYAWGPYYGSNAHALGTGVFSDVRTARLLTGGSAAFEAAEIVKVIPADYVGLALDAGGTVYSWGIGSYSTLGSGSTSFRSGPQAITTWTSDGSTTIAAPRIVDLCPSNRAVAAVASDGNIYAWGQQYGLEVGLPDSSGYSTPRRVTDTLGLTDTVGTADRIVQVSAGNRVAIWLDAEGVVRTSGTQFNSPSQPVLGQGVAGAQVSATATAIGGDLAGTAGTATRIVQVDAGSGFGLALGRDGAIYAWGGGSRGRLGLGDADARTTPVELPRSGDVGSSSALPALTDTAKRITQVSAGSQHCLALGLDGSVYAWGSARYGKLGNGISTDTTYAWPIDITGNGALPAAGGAGRIIQVVAGLDSSYALGADGSVYSWGEGAEYQRGDNDSTESQPDPVLISGLGAFADLKPSDGTAYSRVVYLSTHPSGEADVVYALDNSSLL